MNPQPPSDEDALGRDRPRPVGQSPDNVWHILEGALWACVLLLLLLLLLAPLRTKVLLANPVWAKLGHLSYSIYLLHLPLFTYALRALSGWGVGGVGWNARSAVVAALMVAACIALAQVTYTTIERPFLVRKARIAT